MSVSKCECYGCKNKNLVAVNRNWGKQPSVVYFCQEHSPVKPGQKQSEPAKMFGTTKSWYTLVARVGEEVNFMLNGKAFICGGIITRINADTDKKPVAFEKDGKEYFSHYDLIELV